MKTFFKYDGADVTDEDFLKGLRQIGIREGNTIYVSSDITVFGKSVGLIAEELLQGLVEVLEKSVGNSGTVVMPTYTYSFCKKERYSIQDSPSMVGVLTEFFRKQKDVVRTKHPIFSTAIWGRGKNELSDVGTDSFDKDSIFAKLVAVNGTFVAFGASMQSSFTFLHHIEQAHGVAYRKIKKFSGTIVDGSKAYSSVATYFVRPLEGDFFGHLARLEANVKEKGLVRETKVGNGLIFAIDLKGAFNEGMRMLDSDPFSFLEKAPPPGWENSLKF